MSPAERPARRAERRAAVVRRGRLRALDDAAAPGTITYGWHASPFGPALLAFAGERLAGLAFCPRGDRSLLDVLARDWGAPCRPAPPPEPGVVDGLFAAGPPPPMLVRGTEFELAVWARLLAIPPGQTLSYRALAAAVGRPRAQRAAGRAVGANRIAMLIPCHRVLPGSGGIGGYRWGVAVKRALLAREGVGA